MSPKKKRTSDVEIMANITFDKMMLSGRVLRGLTRNGFTHPSPIQLRAIPLGISSMDLLMQAKSGTGKTLVFSTIVLEHFRKDITAPQSLIITPTRELAVQIEQNIALLGTESSGFRVGSFIGGLNVSDDRKKLEKCKCVVGSPGRIVHLIKKNLLNTREIRIVVLDEVDKLLTETFTADIDFIFKSIPKKRQVIASSATYDTSVETAIKKYMKNPIGVTPKKEAPVLLGVKQFVYELEGENLNQMQEMNLKVKAVTSILSSMAFKQCLIFSNSQQRAESYSNYLTNEGWECDVIMGAQEQCRRLDIFKKFKEFNCRILIATDLMARGVDSENVNLVINLDVPGESTSYLHRIGRCGRFGSAGIAVTLVHSADELTKFRKLIGSIGGSEMMVRKFPKDQSGISIDCSDLTMDEEISGITPETEIIDKTSDSEHEVTDVVRKNLDLLEISKRLVDNPNSSNVDIEEDLFESYSMVVNDSYILSDMEDVRVPNKNTLDLNSQFIDAIARLNLYPEEVCERKSTSSKDVNDSKDNGDDDVSSNTDGSFMESDESSTIDSYESSQVDDSDECSYVQSYDSESEEDPVSNLSSKTEIENRWRNQFAYQISVIQNYVSNSRSMRNLFPQ